MDRGPAWREIGDNDASNTGMFKIWKLWNINHAITFGENKESGWPLVEQTCFSHLPDVQVWPPAQRPTSLGYCRVDTSTCHGPG